MTTLELSIFYALATRLKSWNRRHISFLVLGKIFTLACQNDCHALQQDPVVFLYLAASI